MNSVIMKLYQNLPKILLFSSFYFAFSMVFLNVNLIKKRGEQR